MQNESSSENKGVLYSKEEADFLSEGEKVRTDQRKIDLILKYIEKSDSVLEIGCGSG